MKVWQDPNNNKDKDYLATHHIRISVALPWPDGVLVTLGPGAFPGTALPPFVSRRWPMLPSLHTWVTSPLTPDSLTSALPCYGYVWLIAELHHQCLHLFVLCVVQIIRWYGLFTSLFLPSFSTICTIRKQLLIQIGGWGEILPKCLCRPATLPSDVPLLTTMSMELLALFRLVGQTLVQTAFFSPLRS